MTTSRFVSLFGAGLLLTSCFAPFRVESFEIVENSITMVEGDVITLKTAIEPEYAKAEPIEWFSYNTEVAEVFSSGELVANMEGKTRIEAVCGGFTDYCDITVRPKTYLVQKLTMIESLSLRVGETKKMEVTISPANATNKTLEWESLNVNIATVDSQGYVKAIKPGTTYITCRAMDGSGIKAECAVTVSSIMVSSISLDKTSLALTVGDSYSLKATVSPSSATDKSVTWASSNTSVATVSSSGLVIAKDQGTANITCTATDGSGRRAVCNITVSPAIVYVSSISLNSTSRSLTIGNTYTLTATVLPSNASNKSVTWKSSNTSVATVSSAGLVTAKAAGTATITCTAADGSGKYATCKVTVTSSPVYVTSISLNSSSRSLSVGDTYTLTATVLPSYATNKSVTWKSSNTSVATVSSAGVVTAKAVGTATITCTAADGSGKYATCKVTVTSSPVYVTSISLTSRYANGTGIQEGASISISPVISPSNASNKSVTWSSDNTDVATVSSGGVISAKKSGVVTITCKANDGSGVSATLAIWVFSGTSNRLAYVDMGLGVKWSGMNIGAGWPADNGTFFAWGETAGKTTYSSGTYKWSNSGVIYDYYKNLLPTYDAAHALWEGQWRMPTAAEMSQLREKCSKKTITWMGVGGIYLTASNGNSIFIPLSGYKSGSSLVESGESMRLWSATLSSDTSKANSLYYTKTQSISAYNQMYKYLGLPIRPVLP